MFLVTLKLLADSVSIGKKGTLKKGERLFCAQLSYKFEEMVSNLCILTIWRLRGVISYLVNHA